MHYRQSIDGCLADAAGAGGLTRAEYAAALKETVPAIAALRTARDKATLPLLALPDRRDDLPELAEVARDLRERFDTVVVLGTGGSSLGGRTLATLSDWGFGPRQGAPRLVFLDNIDPATLEMLVARVDLERACLLAISKSGGTAETLAQLLALVGWMEHYQGKGALARSLVAITEPGDRPLRRFAGEWGARVLDHDPGVGGRYAALSLVGILPAILAGLDPVAIREGAASVLDATLDTKDPAGAPPAVGAAVSVALARHRGVGTSVFLPYSDRLRPLGQWWRQLWAESLGKGGMGTTPVDALGTVDQHSQLQLWLDGPADKMVTVVTSPTASLGERLDADLAGRIGAGYLGGRTPGDLLAAMARATVDTLVSRGRPTRTLELDRVDAPTMGALMMHFMLETIVAAHLLGVDPWDQPAVEDGKVLARRYLAESPGV
ncbi:MAG: glucose-6-phosphate isomerase [Alphaproteobacteria bacterium]